MQIVQALKRVDKSNLDVMHTVIVPDRSTLEMERLILQEIGGSFNVQVLTFRRLASRILPKYEYIGWILLLKDLIPSMSSSRLRFSRRGCRS